MQTYENLFSSGALVGSLLMFVVIILLIALAVYVLNCVGLYKIFKKANMDNPGLRAFIPYYNTWSLVELSKCHWWFIILILANSFISFLFNNDNSVMYVGLIINLIVIYVQFCVNYNIAKKFNQGAGFAIGMTLVPFIFYLILGFSNNYEYNDNVKVNKWGYYDFENKQLNTKEKKFCADCGSEMSGDFCPKCGKKGE